jgi:hypothetical protein
MLEVGMGGVATAEFAAEQERDRARQQQRGDKSGSESTEVHVLISTTLHRHGPARAVMVNPFGKPGVPVC